MRLSQWILMQLPDSVQPQPRALQPVMLLNMLLNMQRMSVRIRSLKPESL